MFHIRSSLRAIPNKSLSRHQVLRSSFTCGSSVNTRASQKAPELTSNHPLGKALLNTYVKAKKEKKRATWDKSRLNIVSESLCDDVIQRLSQSLQKHQNCDIIDVNPGVGLWSSKLHDAIKPRTHILMEPDQERYLPFLQPLIDEEASTYKFIPKSGLIWSELDELMSGDLLSKQHPLPPYDPRLGQPNDTLLFVANLGYYPKKPFLGFASIATLTLHQLMTAIRTNSLFHRYGLIRMLVWIQDSEKAVILPRLLSYRRRFAVEVELACRSVNEIAGSDAVSKVARREHAVNMESAKAVKKRMDEAGITTPSSRIGTIQQQAANDTLQIGTERSYWPELQDLERRYEAKEFCSYYDADGKPVYIDREWNVSARSMQKKTPEFVRLRLLRNAKKQDERESHRAELLIQEYASIESEIVSLQSVDDVDAAEKRARALEKLNHWREHIQNLPDKSGVQIMALIEERRALRQSPPILLWDRREAEPLKTVETDFYPEHEMCLLDFQPKELWPIIGGKNLTNYDYFDFLMNDIMSTPGQTLVSGLKALAPGAAEWIIPRCPSLTDTTNGGVVDLDLLRVRALNGNMLREIMEAWMDWPFRPTKAELVRRTGGGAFEEESSGNALGTI